MSKQFLYYFLILQFSIAISAGVEFPKSMATNIEFPPPLIRHENMATGHLRPLGWQNRAQGPVKEETFILTPENFWNQYIQKIDPVMIRGLVSSAESLEKWTDSYLSKKFGHLDIQVTKRKQSLWESKKTLDLKKFLRNYRSEDMYLNVIMPEDMQHETPIPGLISCGPFIEYEDERNAGERLAILVEPHLWISAGETSSLIHAQPEHNMHCMLDGRMDFILMPVGQFKGVKDWKKKLDIKTRYLNSEEMFSKIDVDMVNAYKYDILKDVKWYWSTLKAGDCIYIPRGYLHQIRSHGRSISTSVYFSTFKRHDLTADQLNKLVSQQFVQCPPDAPSFESMDMVKKQFMWAHTHGSRHLNARNLQAADAKAYLVYLMNKDSDLLYYETFEAFIKEIANEAEETIDVNLFWNQFSMSQTDMNMSMNYAQIDSLTTQNLKRFVNLLNKVASAHDNVGRLEL